MQILIQQREGQLRFCISTKCPGDARCWSTHKGSESRASRKMRNNNIKLFHEGKYMGKL